jgi:hypothetical protein
MDGLAGRFSIEDGNMVWGTASSGTAGTVATVDTKMTLLNNGNLGINATDPVKTLDVRGSLAISNSTASYWYMDRNDTSGNFDLNENVNGTLFTVTPNGNVGIGVAADTSVRTFIKGSDSGTNNFQILTRNSSDENVLAVRNDGNVGIGTASPSYPLDITGAIRSSSGLYLNNASGGFLWNQANAHIAFGTNNTEKMRLTSGGTIFMYGLGGYTASYADVRYDTTSKELYYQTSSKRYKTDIVNLENSLDKINSLRPVRYKDINTETLACGLIAEEVVETIPEVVFKKEIEGFDEPQIEGLNYTDLIPFLIKSIQELKAEIDDLKNKCNCK